MNRRRLASLAAYAVVVQAGSFMVGTVIGWGINGINRLVSSR